MSELTGPAYIIGLDLGQAADFTAAAILEQTRPAEGGAIYACRHLARWQLGSPYPGIVKDVVAMAGRLPGCHLAIDGTGCGRAVVDLFRESGIQASCYPILITAGHATSRDEHGYIHVPKRDLASTVQTLLQTGRLKIAAKLSLRAVVEKELAEFKVKISNAGNETFAADWREGQHDDLCLSVMLAAWVGENHLVGPWVVPLDRGSRSVFENVPEGVFLDQGPLSW